ncbi:MAG: L-rhamnose mutarotase [Bacteroides sp. SM23_62_1]|nr:MAG: L-rhamnose mutarotase [Bacteroides sp. SM23_62_1]
MKTHYRRFCKTLTLKDDPELIKKYREVHSIGKVWPDILQGMKEVGIIDMEIYIRGSRLFMIMDTVEDFDHEKAMGKLARKPRQAEWEVYVSRFQDTSPDATADAKWQLMERIFEMDQEKEYEAIKGQLKRIKS